VRVHHELARVDPRELGAVDASQHERPALHPQPHVEEPSLVAAPRQLDAKRLPAHRVERMDEREPAGLLGERVRPDRARGECLRHRHPRRGAAAQARIDDRLVRAYDLVRGPCMLDKTELCAVWRERIERPAAADHHRPLTAGLLAVPTLGAAAANADVYRRRP